MTEKITTLLNTLRKRCGKIEKQLQSVSSEPAKAELREEIITFYKEISGYLRELLLLQEWVRTLAEKFRTIKLPVELKEDEQLKAFIEQMRGPRVDVLTLIDKGWNYICVGDYDGAVAVLTRATKLAPSDSKALNLLGWAYMYKENYDEALAIYQKVLVLEPDNCLARNNLGYICFRKGIYGEAIEHLSEVIRRNTDRTATLYAHYYFGLLYLDREMFDDAVNFLKRTVELGPNLIEAYYHLGAVYEKRGEIEEAIRVWKQGAKRLPNNRWARKCEEEVEARSKAKV